MYRELERIQGVLLRELSAKSIAEIMAGKFEEEKVGNRRGHVFLGKHLIFLCFTNGHALEIVL